MKYSWFINATVMATLASLVVVFSPTGLAQSDVPASYVNVVIVQVKPAMQSEFEALQKEFVAAWKKGGFPSRNIWQVVRGHSNEYHIVTPLEKLADLDESRPVMSEPDMTRWIARVTKCVESRRVLTLEDLSDLSIPARPGRTPRFAQLILTEIALGRDSDFAELREKEMLPAYKKAGFDGLYVHRTRFGDSNGLWPIVLLADSWADLDGPSPLQRGLSEGDYQALVSKLNQMTVSRERLVLRYRPDLSHNPD